MSDAAKIIRVFFYVAASSPALAGLLPPQGASPADVKAQLAAAATVGAVKDDPAKASSFNGTGTVTVNISSTPNRLLYSMLRDQVTAQRHPVSTSQIQTPLSTQKICVQETTTRI